MRRFSAVVLVMALALAGLGAQGCQRTVKVRSGVRVMCTEGHVISDSIKTIEVPAAKAGDYTVVNETRTCDKHSKLADLYAAAQEAITKGDLKSASEKLKQVVAEEPTYRKAKTQLDTIVAGKTPTPDTGTPGTNNNGGGTTPPPPNTPDPATNPTETTTGALTIWIPGTLSGWTAKGPSVDPLTVARQYLPSGGSKAVSLVIVAEQYSTETAAKAGLATKVKQAYAKDAATFTINGHSAYFGTDGRRFGVLGFTAGPVMVALEADGKSDTPKELRGLLEDAAKQLP